MVSDWDREYVIKWTRYMRSFAPGYSPCRVCPAIDHATKYHATAVWERLPRWRRLLQRKPAPHAAGLLLAGESTPDH